ncbi:hypothetical protein Tco_0438441 [Tanacetum coccineum]
MTKVTDLEANLEQFKIEQAAINSQAAKQLALLQATIEKNKVEADQQFAEIMNALKALQPPTTLPEDTTTMIDTEKSGEDCGNLDEFMVASDVEEAAITTPIMVVAEELGQKLIYDFGEADLMLGSEGKSMERVSCDPLAGNKSVEKENIKSGITCEENCYQPYRRVVEQSHNMFGWHAMRLKRRRGIYLGHLETIFWFKQGSKRRIWDPGITGVAKDATVEKAELVDEVSSHREVATLKTIRGLIDKAGGNVAVADVVRKRLASIEKFLKQSNVMPIHNVVDVEEGKLFHTNDAKTVGAMVDGCHYEESGEIDVPVDINAEDGKLNHLDSGAKGSVTDKFAHIKGESLHQYYLRFTQQINDMNIYNMKVDQFQVNTKFLNSLPHEWSKFVIDVKLVKDLHTTNFDQLYAYLEQHKLYANEVRLMCERNQDPLALVVNHQMTPPHFNTYQLWKP